MNKNLHKKKQTKTEYNHQEQYRQQKYQRNRNNQKTKMEGKNLDGHFKRQRNKFSYKKTWTG